MAPKEPTKNQYSKGLGYSAKTPAFLVALQQRVAGTAVDDSEDYNRPDRPPIPVRPDGESSGDEESDAEKPQIVVLKEGKHLTELEVENEKRKAKGLPPLKDKSEVVGISNDGNAVPSESKPKDKEPKGLSFSSSSKAPVSAAKKRKLAEPEGLRGQIGQAGSKKTKKPKKESKGLLSFGDGED